MRRTLGMIAAVALTAVVGISGCSTGAPTAGSAAGEGTVSQATESKAGEPDAISIDDLEWTVDEGLVDGTRRIVFTYTNNSDFTLMGMNAKFRQRSDVTDEQRTVFDSIYANNEYWEEMNGGRDEVYIAASSMKLIEPGETGQAVCTFNSTATAVDNLDQYALMEPDIFEIGYVADGKLYVEYYDFASNEYSLASQSGRQAKSWPDTDIAASVPEPKSSIVSVTMDDEDYFSATVLGFDQGAFDAYVEQCKEAGFTVDASSGSQMYTASTEDGTELTVSFSPSDECMSVHASKD